MLPHLVFLSLLGVAPPLWLIRDPWPIIDSYVCFAFRAPRHITGPTTLAVPARAHIGELVKELPDGTWKTLDTGDILQGQVVVACHCGEVFVMPVLWPPSPQRPAPWKTPCPTDMS